MFKLILSLMISVFPVECKEEEEEKTQVCGCIKRWDDKLAKIMKCVDFHVFFDSLWKTELSSKTLHWNFLSSRLPQFLMIIENVELSLEKIGG